MIKRFIVSAYILIHFHILFASDQIINKNPHCLSPKSNTVLNINDICKILVNHIDKEQLSEFNTYIEEYTISHGTQSYIKLLTRLFKQTKKTSQKTLINFLQNPPSTFNYQYLNNAALVQVFQLESISDKTFNEVFKDKKFRDMFNALTSLIISRHEENPEIINNAKAAFKNYLKKEIPKNITSYKEKKPKAISISGGTGASALVAETLMILNQDQDLTEEEFLLYIIVSHLDDGGSQFKLMESLYKAGYGILSPLSDQMNALFTGFATSDKLKYILGNAGRIKSSDVTSAHDFTLNLLIKTILDGEVNLSSTFFTFAKDILDAMKLVDEELVKKGIISLEKGSLRSLYFLGKLLEKKVIKINESKNKKVMKRNAISKSEQDHFLIEQIVDEISQNCGIEKGRVSICSYDQLSPYGKYNEHILFLQTSDTQSNDSITLSVGENDEITYVKALGINLESNYDGSFNLIKYNKKDNNERIILLPDEILEIGNTQIINENHSLYLKVNEKKYLISEDPKTLSLKLIDLKSKRNLEFARDGSGRLIEYENQKSESKDVSWIDLNGEKILFRNSFLMMQTHITETANIAGIRKFGFLSNKIGFDKGEFKAVPKPNKFSKPNNEAVKQIDKAKPGDYIFIGPGSTLTSLLPHFNVKEIVQALKNAKKRGVQVVLIMNGTYDNETVGSSPQQILSWFEDVAKNDLETFISSIIMTTLPDQDADKAIDDFLSNKSPYASIINEWIEEYLIKKKLPLYQIDYVDFLKNDIFAKKEIKERYQLLIETTKNEMELEIRTDPAAASVASKKSYGVIHSNEALEAKFENIKIHSAPLISIIPFVDRKTGKTKHRAGYSPYELAKVLQKLMIKNHDILSKKTDDETKHQKKKSDLINLDIDQKRKLMFIKKKQQQVTNEKSEISYIDYLFLHYERINSINNRHLEKSA